MIKISLARVVAVVISAAGLVAFGNSAVLASPSAQKAAAVPGLKGIKGLSPAEIGRWKRLAAEASAEGNLTIVGGTLSTPQYASYWNAFGSEFGIHVTTIGGSPTAISTRILAERQQGVHTEDIVITGDTTMGRIEAAGGFQQLKPLILLPQLLDRSTGWYYSKFPWCPSDPAHQYCTQITFTPAQNVVKFYYNTQLVSKKNLGKIRSWSDLLNTKWQGKVVMLNVAQGVDPQDVQLGWALLGKKYWAKFMSVLKPTVLGSGQDATAVNGLARGQWDFAYFEGDITPYTLGQQEGLPIAFFTKILKPGGLPDLGQDVAVMAQAPDQAAAELYLNWSMTPEGQAAWNNYIGLKGDAALRSTVPRGTIPIPTWLAAIHTKRIYIAANHAADLTNAEAWWTQEMAKLNIH